MSAGNAALRKISAITAKDFVDLFKNPGMLVCLLMPLGLTAMQAFLMPSDAIAAAAEHPEASRMLTGSLLISGIAMSIAMIGSMAILYSLAEEKEKCTLRTLILSNVSAEQVMIAKALVGALAIAISEVACFFVIWKIIPGTPLSILPAYFGLGVLGTATVVLPSLVLGLACRDQMTASFYSVPIVFLAMAPIFGMMSDDAERVVRFAPTGGVCELLTMAVNGTFTWGDAVVPLAVTVAWIAGGVVLFKLLYRRLAQDN